MIVALVQLIIFALVIGILLWLVFWVVDSFPAMADFGRIVKIVAVVLAVLVLVLLLLNFAGIDTGVRVPS